MSDTETSITLGIEISNPSAAAPDSKPSHAIALWDDDRTLLGSAPLPQCARGSDGVLSAIATLALSCQAKPNQIRRILVSVGPGGYTALRIATTSAKILADTLAAELVAVPTPRVAAIRIDAPDQPALVALASKKDRTHATIIGVDTELQTLGVIEPCALEKVEVSSIYADRHLPQSFVEHALTKGIPIRPISLDARDLLAASRGCSPVDPLLLYPAYAREPDAVTQWRARESG